MHPQLVVDHGAVHLQVVGAVHLALTIVGALPTRGEVLDGICAQVGMLHASGEDVERMYAEVVTGNRQPALV